MIQVDGSEGGGQLFRTAIALSAITTNPVEVINIRGARESSGLKMQHLVGIEAAAKMCNAKTSGAKLGSQEVTFKPGKIRGGKYEFDIGTAGSITLLLQTLVPIACFADKKTELVVKGGTDVAWSPTYNYFDHILCSYLHKLGIDIERNIIKHGFYPKGGGEVRVIIHPCRKFKPLTILERGEITKIDLHSIASDALKNARVTERMVEGFNRTFNSKVNARINYVRTLCPGASLTANAYYEGGVLGSDRLGELKKKAEDVGKECAEDLLNEIDSGAALDSQMADQILIYLALADGDSEFKTSRISNHIKTNIQVIEKFLPVKFKVDGMIIWCRKI